MVTMWALRLIAHLASRYKGVEDWRFKDVLRERWAGWSPAVQATFCFHYVFVTQAVVAMLIGGSAMHVLKNAKKDQKILEDKVVIAGACIWAIGFAFEFFADLQLIDY